MTSNVYYFILAIAASVLFTGWVSSAEAVALNDGNKMAEPTTTKLFSLIHKLGESFPLTPQKLKHVIHAEVKLVNENDYVKFYEAGPIALANDVILQKLDYRAHKTKPKDKGFVVLNLQGTCIKLSEVRQHFHQLEVTQTPKGHSELDTTSYSEMTSWGKLSFSFMESNPDCLSSVALDPQAKSLFE